jgi:hypothetical protein
MKTKQNIILAAACALLSVSCGTSYQNPTKDPAKTAVLQSDSTRSGLATWANYVVEVVDERPINYLTSWTTASKEIVVPAGKHSLVLAGTFNRGFGTGGPYTGRGDLSMTFRPGLEYKANGKVEGSKVAMWIEESATSKPVSETIRVPYQILPRSTYTPIFIPVAN